VFPDTPATADDFILDFGCGCGRVARQLMLQSVSPRKYLGLDLHRGMIRWCRENLTSRNPNFTFEHQNVYNPGLNPKGRRRQIAFPAGDRSVSLLIAQSVFTHLVESQAQFYLRETGRVLREDGVAAVTFFLFDKAGFPMMQEFQNALYINLSDPTNAVIFDRDWLCRTATEAGLRIARAEPPAVRGFHWQIQLQRARPGAAEHAPFPPDEAHSKPVPPPLLVKGAHRLGT
jgi:SAM-dependent methyltransferase